jgi:hypothetical protein
VRARAAQQQGAGIVARHAAAERPILAHGVEAIDDGEDAGRARNLFPFERVRVAEAVPAFVVVANDWDDRIREVDLFENLRADGRVNLHPLELGRGEFARLVQDVIGHGQLAHVVQQRARLQGFDLGRRQAEDAAQARCVNLHAADVAVGRLILRVNRGG